MNLHDLVFAVGSAVLLAALVPAVARRTVLPLATCALTGGVLAVFAVNYLTLGYWYALGVESANAACWLYLSALAWRA